MYICEISTLNRLERTAIEYGMLILVFLASTAAAYLVIFVFGASLIEDLIPNLMFSIFITSICVMPAFVLIPHANPWKLFYRLFVIRDVSSRLEEVLVVITYGTVIGAWFGCFVMPLDWDRWWQKWPLPSLVGAIIGASFNFIYFWGKTIFMVDKSL